MDKFDRIYALHGLFSNRHRPVSSVVIRDELECSKATVTRLISQMRLYLDAPIEYDRLANGYYYNHQAEHPYELPGLWFNTSELHALLTAHTLLESVDPGIFNQQLAPLKKRIEHILENAGKKDEESGRRICISSRCQRCIRTQAAANLL